MAHLSEQIIPLGALSEPTRRSIYEYVVSRPSPVSREQVADAAAMPLHSVRFHLEKLVDAGLLEVEHRRLSGRSGPGAGRPSKLYRRSSHPLSVSLPPRSYDLAGRLLAAAIERASDELPVRDALHLVARDEGVRLARDATNGPPPADASGGGIARVAAVLAEHGYEPRVVEDVATLVNCPFDRLAAEHTDLVCGMNLHLIGGILEGLQVTCLSAQLAPEPGLCCVQVAPVTSDLG